MLPSAVLRQPLPSMVPLPTMGMFSNDPTLRLF
jgi:hypothetical protein